MLQINTISRLDIGVKDENNARDLYIDCNAWLTDFPNGSFSIWHKRNGDETKYAASGVSFDRETGILKWTPDAYDTFYIGKGLAEIRLSENDVIKKTKDIITECERSLVLGSGETLAAGWQNFLNAVSAAQSGAEDAQEAAEDAAEAAEEARDAAEDAVAHNPIISELTGTWLIWDPVEEEYVDTELPSRGPQGETGETGPAGQDGAPGSDGVSPEVSSEIITGGHRITIVDAEGTTTVDVMDGEDGENGQDGSDGVSPTISSESITGGHRLTIVDAEGTTTVDVMDGEDGQDGAPGQDGADGQDGQDGVSPTVSISEITGGHRISITDAQGTSTADVMDGVDGQDGQQGEQGPAGQDGYTPVKGTDYWTAADKAEMVEDTAEALIDDTAGEGDEDVTWSADKLADKNTLTKTIDTPAAIQTFTDGAAWPMEMEIAIEPVQAGSGDPSPENVRPITGWDWANVAANGKNWCPIKLDKLKELNTAGTWSENVYTRTGIKFTVNADDQGNVTSIVANGTASADWVTLRLFDNTLFRAGSYEYTGITNGSLTTYRITLAIDDVDLPVFQSGTYSIEQDKDFLLHSDFIIRMSGYVANNVTIYPMIRLVSETDTTFEPYKGATYPITFPTSAGTVYGGTLTVHADRTGTLVVDRAVKILTGSDFIGESGVLAGRFFTDSWIIDQNKLERRDFLCNMASTYTGASAQSTPNTTYISSNMQVIMVTTGFTLAQFQAYVNDHPYMLVYGVKPKTYTLSVPQVLSILGQNNVWADCGNINKLSYVRRQDIGFIREDTAGQIRAATDPMKEELGDAEAALAIMIDGDTAPKNISSGQYVFVKNHSTLAAGTYHATAAIASGASVSSSNLTADPDGAINALLAIIQAL